MVVPNANRVPQEDRDGNVLPAMRALLPGEEDAVSLQEQIAELQERHGADQQKIDELRRLLTEAHEELLCRDNQLMRVCGLKTADLIDDSKSRERWEDARVAGLVAKTRIEELVDFMDCLDSAIDRIYQTRRWRWSNPISNLGKNFTSRFKLRGYWRIDEILARYKEWKQKNPEYKR